MIIVRDFGSNGPLDLQAVQPSKGLLSISFPGDQDTIRSEERFSMV